MRWAWLGMVVCLITGLSGCRSMHCSGTNESYAGNSQFSSVIRNVAEPAMTIQEAKAVPERNRIVRRSGKTTAPSSPDIPAFAERDPSEFATTKPNGVEQGFEKLPKADLAKVTPAVAIKPNDGPFRAITEADVRSLAAARAPTARRIEMENMIPASHSESAGRWHRQDACPNQLDQFMRQARELMSQGDRVKSVSDAAGLFYQLAEAEGRAEILRAGVVTFDEMRAEVGKLPKLDRNGRPIPLPDDSTLNSQRGQLLETATLLQFSVRTLNIDLKQLTGLVGHTTDRLYPTGEFGIDLTPLDVPSLVSEGVANRPDLQLLRLAYFELNEDTLPAIRDQLRLSIGMLSSHRLAAGIAARHHSIMATALERFGKRCNLDPVLVHELAIRRAQLFDMVCEKEREVADQVRKAVAYLETSAALVESTRTRSEDLKKRVDASLAVKNRTAMNMIGDLPLMLEWYKARAEVIQAVMNWHQARVKLKAAQGKVE